MDADNLRELRDSYESALDEAEAKRAEFHEGVRRLHASGMTMRDIADALGISHQRVHQIVSGAKPRARGRRAAAGGAAILVVLAAGLAFLYGNVSSPDRAVRAFSELVEALSEDRLRQAWMGFEALYGEYASHGSATASNLGGFVVLNVPLAMANGPAKARISFQSDGKIAGLYLLRQDAP